MSYEVLARKWRPQTFDEVVGQDHITRTLKKAVETGRMAHAYLFSGPRGCGKTSTARILAKVLNCTDLQAGNPCNKCPSCQGVITGRNLDVMEIDGASHTGVNEVRDLQESIGYAPSQHRNKVYVIDEVHMLSTHAFNALLKTLEEPPAHVYFVFATTAAHKIPDTIKSRCQRHQFKRLEIGEIVDQLERICRAEKVKADKDALRLLARKAEGSMRDAESLLDQCITASAGALDPSVVRGILGLLDQSMVADFLATLGSRDATAVLQKLDGAIQQGVDIEELLGALIEGYRDLMLLASPGDLSPLIYRSADEIESLRSLLDGYELGDLVSIVERLCNLQPRLKMASDPRILLESVLVDVALVDRQARLRDLIEKLEGSGGVGNPSEPSVPKRSDRAKKGSARTADAAGAFPAEGNIPRPSLPAAAAAPDRSVTPASSTEPASPLGGGPAVTPQPALPDAAGPLADMDYNEQRRLWEGFTTLVRQKKTSLGVSLVVGTLHSIDDRRVVIRFGKGYGYQKGQVDTPASRRFLKGVMKRYFGRDLEMVTFFDGEMVPSTEVGEGPTDSGPAGGTGRAIESKPIFKKILETFDGEIVRYHP